MIKLKLIGAALVVAAFQLTPALAQVSEPAAAQARDPNFSIYSSGPPSYGYSGAMAQTSRDEGLGAAGAGADASRASFDEASLIVVTKPARYPAGSTPPPTRTAARRAW